MSERSEIHINPEATLMVEALTDNGLNALALLGMAASGQNWAEVDGSDFDREVTDLLAESSHNGLTNESDSKILQALHRELRWLINQQDFRELGNLSASALVEEQKGRARNLLQTAWAPIFLENHNLCETVKLTIADIEDPTSLAFAFADYL